jgi:hypothetical protein
MCAAHYCTNDLGALDTEGNPEAGQGLVKDLLVRCAHSFCTSPLYPAPRLNKRLVGLCLGLRIRDHESYNNNIGGELDIEGSDSDNNDDARWNTSYGEDL